MLEIVKSPNKLLLEPTAPCQPGDKSLKKLAREMAEIMYEYNGVGLAGPQVGKQQSIIVIDVEYRPDDSESVRNPITLINPEIVYKSKDMIESTEGCLSCPGVMAPVMRHFAVKVQYYDLDGKVQTIEGDGLLSYCLQHEIDHLNGKTIFQTSLPSARLELLKDYDKALSLGLKPGEFLEKEGE